MRIVAADAAEAAELRATARREPNARPRVQLFGVGCRRRLLRKEHECRGSRMLERFRLRRR